MSKSTPAIAERAPNAPLKHARMTIFLHWFSVTLVVGAAASILLRELVESGSVRTLLLEGHRQLGLFVLLALSARLAARFTFGMAPTLGASPLPVRLAAHGAHWLLYAILLAIPMLGWAVSNAQGVQLSLLGLVPLSRVVGSDADLADELTDLHVLGSWLMLGVVGLHVAAALYHHFVQKDQVLVAMLPGRAASLAADETAGAGQGAAPGLRRVA